MTANKHTSKATTSTTIEAILELFENNITGKFGDKITKEDALKAIEAEKLKGQISELKRYERNWGNRTDSADLDYIEKQIQSLQQQLEEKENGK